MELATVEQMLLENDLSRPYFQKCADLCTIEEKFPLEETSRELSRRNTEVEFELLRALTETKKHKLKLRVNSISENKKNRYPELSIFEHSRIHLAQGQYINANYVYSHHEYLTVVTQAPTAATVIDFQEMIKEQRIECVMMLCNIVEAGKVRCYDYLDGCVKDPVYSIEDVIEISDVTIKREEEKDYRYRHVFYSEWPDRGVPSRMDHIRKIMEEVVKFKRVMLHCSAGLGRSGVMAAILSILRDGEGDMSVFGTVRRLREHRFGAVQNNEQYRFIYEYFTR